MRIRSNLALILFGMILGALSYRGLNSLLVDRAPAVTQLPAAGADTGPVKWENDTVAPLTKILPKITSEKRRLPMEWLSPGEHTDRRQRTRVPAYAWSPTRPRRSQTRLWSQYSLLASNPLWPWQQADCG